MEKEILFPFYMERHFQGRLNGWVLGNLGYLHEQSLLFNLRQK